MVIDPGGRYEAVLIRRDRDGQAALRVSQPKPGDLLQYGEAQTGFPLVQIVVLHRQRCGVEPLHGVDGADLFHCGLDGRVHILTAQDVFSFPFTSFRGTNESLI